MLTQRHLSLIFAVVAFLIGWQSTGHAAPVSKEIITQERISSLFSGGSARKSTLSGMVVDEQGRGIEGVRIIIDGVGESQSGGDGRFAFTDLNPGQPYRLLIQRTGFQFFPSEVLGSLGDTIKVLGESVVVTPSGCQIRANSFALVSSAYIARQLKADTLANARKLPPSQRLRLLGGEVIKAAELPQRVEEQYATYQFYSKIIPEADYRCEEESSCEAFDVRAAKLFMAIELDNLSHERLLTNRILNKRRKISAIRYTRTKRAVVSSRNRAKRLVESVRAMVGVCQ